MAPLTDAVQPERKGHADGSNPVERDRLRHFRDPPRETVGALNLPGDRQCGTEK